MNNRRFPTGIQNFERIRRGDLLYVGKTELIYQLVDSGSRYFLSHPRHPSKNLFISTLGIYFQSKRELFVGLTPERLEQNWAERLVFHPDLNIRECDAPDGLDKVLNRAILRWEFIYDTGVDEVTLALHFTGTLRRIYEQTGGRVAIPTDEYNKPLL